MKMRFIFSSAVITAPGTYRYRHIDLQAARRWLEAGPYHSTIRYRETAHALGALLGRRIETRDEQVKMQPGDEALIFRLIFPTGTRGLPTDQKGKVSVQFILDHCELGILESVVTPGQ